MSEEEKKILAFIVQLMIKRAQGIELTNNEINALDNIQDELNYRNINPCDFLADWQIEK